MEPRKEERRLTTILAADVVGYSRLTAADEGGTLAQLKTHRKELLDPKIAEYRGRVVKLMGDGALMEFGSVIDAVNFAVDVQRAMGERNRQVPEDRQIIYRVGINIGDIIVEGDDIYGDGVNLATRLEGLADPGGICISGKVYGEIKNKLELGFEDLGEQEVKNIPEPVRVYRVLVDPSTASMLIVADRASQKRWRWAVAAAVVGVAIVGGAVVVRLQPWAPDVEPASVERMAFPLPDKPSIAVLPFANLGGDPGQDLFSDGITNDIITDLSRFDDLMVIASNSTFSYKGKPTKVQRVAEELGVRYVLEGSIQRIGDQVRVNVQFVDAISGEHLWAERYNRELSDIFAIQDEITQKIAAMLGAYEGRVAEADLARAKRRETSSLSAYEFVLLAREQRHRFDKEGNAKSQELLEKAIKIDPQYARAHAEMAWVYLQDAWNEYTGSPDSSAKKALSYAKKAIEIDDSFAEGHWVMADAYLYLEMPDKGVAAYERALDLNPNHADILADWGGFALPGVLGRGEEGVAIVKEAMRLSPFYADWYNRALMNAHFVARQYEEAIAAFKSVEYPTFNSRLILTAAYSHAGMPEEARKEAAMIMEIRPDFLIRTVSKKIFFSQAEVEHIRDGLRKAGLPE